jgi:hypothetical protein
LLDNTVEARLRFLLGSKNPLQQAQEQLRVWDESMPSAALWSLLRKRINAPLAVQKGQSADPELPRVITRQLLSRAIPALFAPALTVLILHGEL